MPVHLCFNSPTSCTLHSLPVPNSFMCSPEYCRAHPLYLLPARSSTPLTCTPRSWG